MRVVNKVWGREEILFDEETFAGKRMVLDAGAACSMHMHPVKDEGFLVVSGSMAVELGSTPEEAKLNRTELTPGDTVHVPPGVWHRFTGGPGGCVFYEFSSRDDPDDNRRAEPSRPGRAGSSRGEA